MTNKTAHVDAEHILDVYRAQQVGTVVCVRSFECEDEDTGEVFTYTAGQSYVAADADVAVQFPHHFAPDGSGHALLRATVPASVTEIRSTPEPAPDVRGLLVCIRAFEFQDPDTGYPR